MHSIRLKMACVMIAAIITSILALGGIGLLTIGAESDRSSAEKMSLISENTQLDLKSYLDSIEQSVSMATRMAHDSLDDPDIVFLGSSGTPEQVDALIREEVEKLALPEGGLCMIYGLYPGVPLENAKALMDAMEKYMFWFD